MEIFFFGDLQSQSSRHPTPPAIPVAPPLPSFPMSSSSSEAQSKDNALSQYAQLCSSPNPNDKLLALAGLIRFVQNADHAFLLQCAHTTDYVFLDKMIRNGISFSKVSINPEIKVQEEIQAEKGHLRQLALAVLSVFGRLPEMQPRNEILERIPALVSCLEDGYVQDGSITDNCRDDIQRNDVLYILHPLAAQPKGADIILSPPCAATLIKLIQATAARTHKIIQLLQTALGYASVAANKVVVLELLGDLFAQTKSTDLINNLLNLFISYFESNPPPKSLQLPLYRGLKNLSTSKLDDTTRSNTLILQSLLLNHLGPSFLFNPPASQTNVIKTALLTIRLASAECRMDLTHLQSAKLIDKRRLVAEMDILHVTTVWLLSSTSEDELLKICDETLSPDEILSIQDSLGSAAKEVALYLRGKYDEARDSGQVVDESSLDAVIRTAVKFVSGWIGEGGSGFGEEENLGLLEVFLLLCSTKDVELVTWAMRGIKGIILYTETGGDELLANKGQMWGLLDLVMDSLSSRTVTEEIMIMIREICNVFRVMVDSQPLMISEDQIRSFPQKLFDRLPKGTLDESTWEAQTEGALLSLEILLKIGESEDGNFDGRTRDLMGKWAVRVRDLIRRDGHGETKEDLIFLASALENLSI